MTHTVSCRPFTAEARIPSHASPYEICGERSDTRGGFNPITSRLHCKQFPTNAPHTYFTNLSSTIYNLSTWQRVYWWHSVVAPYMMNENAVSTVRHNYVYIRSIAYYMFRLLWKAIIRQSEMKEVRMKNSWFQTFAVFWMMYAFFWVRKINYGKNCKLYRTSAALFKVKI